MLVKLPHGMCVNPEIVKLIHVRPDQRQVKGQTMVAYSVVMKTDDDGFIVLATLGDRASAEALSGECARRINKGLGEEEADDKPASKADEGDDADEDLDDDEDEDDDEAPSPAASLLDDDDW